MLTPSPRRGMRHIGGCLSYLSWAPDPSAVRLLEANVEAEEQGLTLVHFSAHRKRFLWDRVCS